MDIAREYQEFAESRRGTATAKQRMLIAELETKLGEPAVDPDTLTPEEIGKLIFDLKRKLNADTVDQEGIVTLHRERPITANADYEVGWQEQPRFENGKMAYLKLYRLLMMDFDSEETFQEAKHMMQDLATVACFSVYKTPRGYHVFFMSAPMAYHHKDAGQFMLSFGCDPCYVLYCKKSGFKVRLSLKPGEKAGTTLARHIELIGDTNLIHPECGRLIAIHDKYIDDDRFS